MKKGFEGLTKKAVSFIIAFAMLATVIMPFIPDKAYAETDTREEITRINISVSGSTVAEYGETIVQPVVEIISSDPAGAVNYLSLGTGGYSANWYHGSEYVAPGNTFGEGTYTLLISVYLSGTGQSLYKWADNTKIMYMNGTRLSSNAVGDSYLRNSVSYNVVAPDGTAPTVTTASLEDGNIGDEYSATLAADGIKPIKWLLESGSSLPSGLSLAANGVISGTPTVSGNFGFTVVAANSVGTAKKTLNLRIKNVQKITRINLAVSGTTVAQYGEKITQPIAEIISSEPADAVKYLSFGTGGYSVNWYRDGKYVAPGNTFEEGEYRLQASVVLSGTGQSLYKWSDNTAIIYINGTRLSSSGVTDYRLINDLNYTVSATATTHTVKFITDGGSVVADQTVKHGECATRPADPVRDGYTFAGWYSDRAFSTQFWFSTAINNTTLIYAKWIKNLTSLNATVSPLPAAGQTIGDLTVESGDSGKYTIGYYWKKNDAGTVLADTAPIEAGNTYTLYITFDSNDGYTIPDDAEFTVNGLATQWSGFEAKVNRKVDFIIPAEYHEHDWSGTWINLGGSSIKYCKTCSAAKTVNRLAGDSRFDTSIKSANQLKKTLGVNKFDNIVVASGEAFPDALAGSYLACVKNAPMLLTAKNKESVQESTAEYIKDNLKEGGTVYILGGEGAVSGSFENFLAGLNVKRLAGADRYETNIKILNEAGVTSGSDILVCTGGNFADSLSASAVGKPILLVPGKIKTTQSDWLDGLGAGNKFYLIGGEGAVTASVDEALKEYGTTKRVAGPTRFETSVAIAEEFFNNPTSLVLAYSQTPWDGLSAGPLAAKQGAPLLLTLNNDKWVKVASAYVKNAAPELMDSYVLGGPTLINNGNAQLITEANVL
ncbi:MAG: cell wall-binding repeat-containing protein [Lachnospiraceae bacterium]|nr:cell wall-binding repeat-containing protein [Lachnospiraceae bacterium]